MHASRTLLPVSLFAALMSITGLVFVSRSEGSPRAFAESSRPIAAAPALPPTPVAAQDNEKGDEANPRLIVPSLDEPDVALDGKTSERPDFVAPIQGGGFIFERRDSDNKRITGLVVPGLILVNRGLVELFGCGEGVKAHETVIRLETNIQPLDLALTSAGFRRGELPKKTDLTIANQGSRVLILVQWLDKDGKLVTHRSEDLVISIRRNSPMPRVGWTYVGNWMEV